MTKSDREDIATLCLVAAATTDGYLGDSELMHVERVLRRHQGDSPGGSLHTMIAAAIDRMTAEGISLTELVDTTTERLRTRLTPRQKSMVLEDLHEVARADGIVLQEERAFIENLARLWEVAPPDDLTPGGGEPAAHVEWTALHDLALIYLVLAHGTDNELSRNEVQVMLRKLQEWQPGVTEGIIREVLRDAMDRYAEGSDHDRVRRSIRNVREVMPEDQRMAALSDLIQIANADGIFLDDEEDLINDLVAEWEVDPYVTYGRHGRK